LRKKRRRRKIEHRKIVLRNQIRSQTLEAIQTMKQMTVIEMKIGVVGYEKNEKVDVVDKLLWLQQKQTQMMKHVFHLIH